MTDQANTPSPPATTDDRGPASSTSAPHRLPTAVRPNVYRLVLDSDTSLATFDGSASIDCSVLEPTRSITLNAVNLDIAAASASTDMGTIELAVEPDAGREMVTLRPTNTEFEFSIGDITLEIEFTGKFDADLIGYYTSTFTDDAGNVQTIACTQMEAPYARRAFPCWDEPEFKAVFSISLLIDDGLLAVSNSPEIARTTLDHNRVRVDFAPTMKMSTYLVAWVVGALDASETRMVGSTPIRVIAPAGKMHLTEFALDTAEFALRWFEDYYAISYPGEKLDLIAIPDFAFGAMENLGCVTFREVFLLVDTAAANRAELSRVAAVINHEIAHMWFGDLVTMKWWNGIWLNEAFATFMEIACTDAAHPEWGQWNDFGLERTSAFDVDALVSTRPIEIAVGTPDEADAMFDVLTYEKGASVLRMLEQYLGAETFREGVRTYLADHSYANTETHDLWDSLEAVSGQPVRTMMDAWIFTGGHPVVIGETDGESLTIRQTRNTPLSERQSTGWSNRLTPLRFSWVGPGDKPSQADDQVLLAETHTVNSAIIAKGGSLTLNAGAFGFYRTVLDDRLHRALVDNIDQLSAIERYQYIDDLWAGLLAGQIDVRRLTHTLWQRGGEMDPTTLKRMCSIWANLYRVAHVVGRDTRTALSKSIDEWVDLIHSNGMENASRGEIGAALLSLSGRYGATGSEISERCGAMAGYTNIAESADGPPTSPSSGSPDPEVRGAAIELIAAWADDHAFEWLISKCQDDATPQEAVRFLNAMATANDEALIERACEYYLTVARPQDGPFAMRNALAHPLNGAVAWRFVVEHWTEISGRFPANSLTRLFEGVRWLIDPSVADMVGPFLAKCSFGGSAQRIEQHLELQSAHRHLVDRIGADLLSACQRPDGR